MHFKEEDSRVISPGHFVGLKFQEGWWFIQIFGVSRQELKPWILLNENEVRAPIAAQTAGSQDEIRDNVSRRLVEPDDDERNLVFQLLFGVAPSRMQIFPFFGRDQNLGLQESMAPGEDELWITGFDSPYNNATQQSEVIYINDMDRLRLQAYNPMDEAAEARLSIFINKMQYGTVTDVNLMKAMLQGQVPCHKHMMGLGVPGRYQVDTPNWLEESFGEHIMTSSEIIEQGDSAQSATAINIQGEADLASPGQQGGGA